MAVTQESGERLQSMKRAYVYKLIKNLKDRFEGHPVLISFSFRFARDDCQDMVGGNEAQVSAAPQMVCPMLGKPYSSDMFEEWTSFASFVLESEWMQKLAVPEPQRAVSSSGTHGWL